MKSNTDNFQVSSFSVVDKGRIAKKTPEYPKTTAGVIRRLKQDLKDDYQFFIKDRNVKEIKITKIDKKKKTIYLWIHKKDRKGIPRILSSLVRYPFKYVTFTKNSTIPYFLKCTVEVKPKNIPKGIVVLN